MGLCPSCVPKIRAHISSEKEGSNGVSHKQVPTPTYTFRAVAPVGSTEPLLLCLATGALHDSVVCSAMATRGVFQLRKLTVKYCDHSGSSKGAREFIRHRIVEFANNTPAAEVATELRPGQHPYIMGDYVTGEVKTIGIKNIAPGEIMDYALMLRNSSGRKV